MHDDFSKYAEMQSGGASPEQVYQQAVRDDLDPIARIRMIRSVFALSPGHAKDVVAKAQALASSADEQQGQVANALSKAWSQPSATGGP